MNTDRSHSVRSLGNLCAMGGTEDEDMADDEGENMDELASAGRGNEDEE